VESGEGEGLRMGGMGKKTRGRGMDRGGEGVYALYSQGKSVPMYAFSISRES
jgi:hypothetical protein